MGLDFVDEGYGIQSLFPTSDSLGEGFGADGQEAVILDSGKYTEYIQSSELNLGLNILELQAKATITPTPVPNMELEIFSDASGFLNKVDTVNTTATFDTNKYTSGGGDAEEIPQLTTYTDNRFGQTTAETFDIEITKGGYFSEMLFYCYSNIPDIGDILVKFIQNDVEILSKYNNYGDGNMSDSSYTAAITFEQSDYSSLIEPGTLTVSILAEVSGIRVNGNSTYDGDGINFTNTTFLSKYSGYSGHFRTKYISLPKKTIIQTEEMAVPAGIKKFQVVGYKEDTDTDGVINYDISFDGGAHYKTDLPLGSLVDWDIASSSAIIKINFNTKSGTAKFECSGFGLRYWGDE